MDPVEKAIRNAFERGNPLDPAFRDKVYRSVLAALERALQSNPNMTPEAAENRRASVRAKIDEIESEFVPAVEVEASLPDDMPYVEPELERQPGRSNGAKPVVAGADPFVTQPVAADTARRPNDAARHAGIEPEYREVKPRRSWIGALSALIVLAIAGSGIWWAFSSGLLQPAEEVASAPEPQPAPAETETDTEEPAPLSETEAPRDWITVFSPDDPTHVTAPAGTEAEVLEDESGKFLRIRSGADATPVVFDVGQGVLERIAGRRAVFDLVARAEGDQQTQISITCDLGELGQCGRKRYAVGYERGDFLFDIELPDSRPNAGGTVEVVSDIENGGKAIDVYEIRVSIAP